MPKMSNILICDMPLRFDTYKGCSHLCEYCFVKLKTDINDIKLGSSPQQLRNFIEKRRKNITVFGIIDYDLPIHWGGVSDPFQPIEKEKKLSLECLKIFRETQYPFVISTKSDLLATDNYLEILKDCNCAVQYSMIGESLDKFETGASKFQDRLIAVEKISKYKRVIARCQPMLPKLKNELISNLKDFRSSGIYGIIIEFMKYKSKKEGTIKLRGDNVFPYEQIKQVFDEIKLNANNIGIKVFAGENRLRQFGDGLNCCGVGDLWQTHQHNLNHLLFDNIEGKNFGGSIGENWCISRQDTKTANLFKTLNYNDVLDLAMTDKSILSNYTIDKQAYNNIKNYVK